MKRIKNIERITTNHSEWKPTDIAFIKSVEWSSGNLTMELYSQQRERTGGWPDLSKDFLEFSVRFYCVSDLKLKFRSSGLQQISGFDIIDISERGLESINFQIEDYEDGIIDFYCNDIEVLEVLALGKIPLLSSVSK